VVLARTERTFGVEFYAYTFPEIGVWRAWTCLVGNMSARYRGAARLRLAERWFNTLDDGTSNMLLDVVREERVTGAYDESYTYNAIGNITGKGPTGSLVTYGYNASGSGSVRPHAVTSVGGDVYQYDNNGNMTSRTGKALTWNADNTVASMVGPDNVPEGYTYDAGGGRSTRSRNLGQPGGFTTAYVGGRYEEDTPSGDKRVLYSFAGRVVAQRTIVGSTPTVVYLHGDMLGSTGATTSSAGAVTATQRYTPFGTIRAGGSLPTTIDYTGQRRDGTGLLFYNARYYDPTIGRFASSDVIGVDRADPQTRNRYSYVRNNPLRYTDPTGHCYADPQNNEERAENKECDKYISWLKGWGIIIWEYANWMSDQLAAVWQAINDLAASFNWTAQQFISAMGNDWIHIRRSSNHQVNCAGGLYAACARGREITFGGQTFSYGSMATYTKFLVVHEFAHIWDWSTGSALSRGLAATTGGEEVCPRADRCIWVPGERQSLPSPYAATSPGEDWAESVAAWIYPRIPDENHQGYQPGTARHDYVACVGAAYATHNVRRAVLSCQQ
jgi:RHS repeat-associated protein